MELDEPYYTVASVGKSQCLGASRLFQALLFFVQPTTRCPLNNEFDAKERLDL